VTVSIPLRRILSLALSAALVLVLALLGLGWSLWTSAGPTSGPSADALVLVPAGAGPGAIADSLVARGLLEHRRAFLLGCRIRGLDRSLKAGRYLLPYGASPRRLAHLLVEGRSELLRLTVPEGLEVAATASRLAPSFSWSAEDFVVAAEAEVASVLAERGWLPRGRDLASYRKGLEAEQRWRHHSLAEGYLFPETYHWDERMTAAGAAATMVSACLDTMAAIVARGRRDDRSADMTPHELIILASIVEAETPNTEEMPRVAAVYLNRLSRGRLLEADPTVAHALGKKGERILYRDLEVDSEYNTYRRSGLPLGPIGAPGAAAIRAVLQPDSDRKVMYFVADGLGGHVFSETWDEHEQAVRVYRDRRDNRSGS